MLIIKMAQSWISLTRCCLCRRKITSNRGHILVETSMCPVSKKSVRDVLEHLARLIKIELPISRKDYLCHNCQEKLFDYDNDMVRLLQKQRGLTRLVESAMIYIDSDLEDECNEHMATLEELNDDIVFDDSQISDIEIRQTMLEAIDTFKKENKPGTCSRFQSLPVLCQKPRRELIQCNLCAMRFKSKIRLQKHISQAHKKFSCELCTYSHRNEEYVMLHTNVHEGRNENQCRFCDKEFTTKISTIRHMEVHFNSKKYQCDKCGLCFSQTTVLYNHKLQHEAEEQPLRCEICNQVFKTKRTYRHHMITHRVDRPRYSCDYCAKTFTEKYTLKVHKRTHPESMQSPNSQHQPRSTMEYIVQSQQQTGSVTEGKYNCIICDQLFANKDNLNKHMEKEHDVILKSLTLTNFSQYEVVANESKKPCHICGQMFSAQTNLDFHLEHVHGVSFK